MSKITGFTQGQTSSGLLTWYVAILDCKHWYYSEGWQPFSSDIVVGLEIDCEKCKNHAKAIQRLEALDLTYISHFRFDNRFAYPDQGIRGSYKAYVYDASSPAGVLLVDSFPAIDEIDAIIDRKRILAISPTEGRKVGI